MGAVMYSGPGLEQSPYAHLLSPANWQETADLFLRDACALLGLSMESPLTVAVTAGCKALPAHLNNKRAGHAAETGSDATFVPGRNSLVHHFQVFAVWHSKDKLSIEIELGGDCRYHSVEPDQAVNLAWRAAVQQCSGRETHHSGVSFRPA